MNERQNRFNNQSLKSKVREKSQETLNWLCETGKHLASQLSISFGRPQQKPAPDSPNDTAHFGSSPEANTSLTKKAKHELLVEGFCTGN
jgi:hypothetical protein